LKQETDLRTPVSDHWMSFRVNRFYPVSCLAVCICRC